MTRYRTIVADPPWNLVWTGGSGHRLAGNGTRYYRQAVDRLPYRLMSGEQIAEIPVADLAAIDAHLYLWTTDRHLLDGTASAVVSAWGFQAQRILVWRKSNPGMGRGWRPAHELVVLARRGEASFANCSLATVFDGKQVYKKGGGKLHSGKPEAFMDLVEQVSPGPYLEMFARRQRLGWDTWGDEALPHVELAS